ncbi:hypothetical protein [Xylocopilactobacillus apicola]|uniref:Uncharacterized protein n=1 Tax=Xylocopilactobacillus apicola TaxID=2932184 RepID=A0AAU9DA30_9LACO|nr:hypothetical protein [Xylocopilactobacillus apicola]BDR57677.1 hypothetical protein XA3_01180 [Xylocopilactobacillus apicola]
MEHQLDPFVIQTIRIFHSRVYHEQLGLYLADLDERNSVFIIFQGDQSDRIADNLKQIPANDLVCYERRGSSEWREV